MSNTKSYAETQQTSKSANNTPHGKIRQKRNRGKKGKGAMPRPPQTPTQTQSPSKRVRPKNNCSSFVTPTAKPRKKATSYAARIASSRSATTTSVKVRSVTSKSPPSSSLQSTPSPPSQSQHGNLSKEELLNVRMYQRDICYVAGLPLSLCTRAILGTKKWFGQFGRIREITITDNQNCLRTNWMCAHIKYFEKDAAIKAVQAMNGKVLPEGRVLEANYGTQRYCEHFIYRTKCPKTRCPFRHSWCALNEVMHLHREGRDREPHSVSPKKSRRQSHGLHTPQSARDHRSPRKLQRTPSGGNLLGNHQHNQLPVQSPQMFTARSDPSPTKSRVTPQRVTTSTSTPKQFKVTLEKDSNNQSVDSVTTPMTPSPFQPESASTKKALDLETTSTPITDDTPQRDTNPNVFPVPFVSSQELEEMVTPQQQEQDQEQQGHYQHRQHSILEEHATEVMDTTNSPSSSADSTVSPMPISTKTQIIDSSPSPSDSNDLKPPMFDTVRNNSNGSHDTHDSNEPDPELTRNDRVEYNHSQPRALDTDLSLYYASASSDVGSEHVVMSNNPELIMQQRIDAMETAMKKQQEIVAAYKHKYKCMKGAWTHSKTQTAELTKLTQALMEERKRYRTERDQIAAEHDKMVRRYSSIHQQNQALTATVRTLQKEMKRLAAYIHGNHNRSVGSLQAGSPSSLMASATPSPYAPSSSTVNSQRPHHAVNGHNLDIYASSHRNHTAMAQYVQQQQHHQNHNHRQQQQAQQQQQVSMQGVAQIDYHLWQWSDVFRWIMNIDNGRLRRYAPTLQITLDREGVDGSGLKSLNIQDLHRLGIEDLKDKEILMQHINGLQSHLGLEAILDGLDI